MTLPQSALLWITVLCELLLDASLVLTLVAPRRRVWPPPGNRSWQYRFTWGLTAIAMAGAAGLVGPDWDRVGRGHWARAVAGGSLVAAGMLFALWGLRSLGVHRSLGLRGELASQGAYRFSRNPHYVGDIVSLVGLAVLVDSLAVSIVSALGIGWFVLAPFAEEPWLRERFGARYDRYARVIPRFVSLRPRRGGGDNAGVES